MTKMQDEFAVIRALEKRRELMLAWCRFLHGDAL
jgi:hypothetical protein